MVSAASAVVVVVVARGVAGVSVAVVVEEKAEEGW